MTVSSEPEFRLDDPQSGTICLAYTDLKPGTYSIGVKRALGGGHIIWQELIVTVAGQPWRTEVYLDAIEDDHSEARYDLEKAAIIIRSWWQGPDFFDAVDRQTEIARLKFLEGRQFATNAAARALRLVRTSPMVALYTAYVMARNLVENRKAIAVLCRALERLWTSNSPDVHLLKLSAGIDDPTHRSHDCVSTVPMIADGWLLMASGDTASRLSQDAQLNFARWRVASPLWSEFAIPADVRSDDAGFLPATELSDTDIDAMLLKPIRIPVRPRSSSLAQSLRRELLDLWSEGTSIEGPALVDRAARSWLVDRNLVVAELVQLVSRQDTSESVPELVMEVTLEPKTQTEMKKMRSALRRLSTEDPSFRVSIDHESGQTIIKGMGELHLDIIVDRMRREFKVEANVGAPQVAYREYLAKPVDIDYTHKKQSGGTGQFGRVKVKVTPGERGTGFVFKDEIKGGNIPKEYIPAIEKGFRETAESGSLIGFPIIDFEVLLYDGAYHDVDSSALAFEIAARGAMREVAQKAGIKLLEPIMKVEVVTPEEYLGEVIGDLNSRRGQILGTGGRGNAQVVNSIVPLAKMFGYVNQLRQLTQGRAQYTMSYSHYDEVPAKEASDTAKERA